MKSALRSFTKILGKEGKFDEVRKRRYLEAMMETGEVETSCVRAGVSRVTVNNHRDKDEAFAAAEQEAYVVFKALVIEAEMKRRSIDGIIKPVFYMGERVDGGKIREFSDMLLIAYAKRHEPAYRDRQTIDHNVTGGVLVLGGGEKNAEDWAATEIPSTPDTKLKR